MLHGQESGVWQRVADCVPTAKRIEVQNDCEHTGEIAARNSGIPGDAAACRQGNEQQQRKQRHGGDDAAKMEPWRFSAHTRLPGCVSVSYLSWTSSGCGSDEWDLA